MRDIRVVTPFRPFPPESREHRELGPFDWIDAIQMLRTSVTRFSHCETVAITDVDTTLPGPTFHYTTRERRLMFWILEVSLCYLAGPDFTKDTVMVSPDSLVFCDLRDWFAGEFGIVVRPRHPQRPILNAVQWWPVQSRDKLVALYTDAIAIAKRLPADLQVWGADSEPFRKLLRPLLPGCGPRRSGIVANLVDSHHVMVPMSGRMIDELTAGQIVGQPKAVVDFRYTRKKWMRAYFDATIGRMGPL